MKQNEEAEETGGPSVAVAGPEHPARNAGQSAAPESASQGVPQGVPQEISMKIYSFNSAEIGEMVASDDGVVLRFAGAEEETKEIALPAGEIKAASVARVGRIGMDNYVMRIFIALPLAARLRKELENVSFTTALGAGVTAQTFSIVTGEHVDFYINSRDVFGVNARGGTLARRFMDIVNKTTPERLRLPD